MNRSGNNGDTHICAYCAHHHVSIIICVIMKQIICKVGRHELVDEDPICRTSVTGEKDPTSQYNINQVKILLPHEHTKQHFLSYRITLPSTDFLIYPLYPSNSISFGDSFPAACHHILN